MSSPASSFLTITRKDDLFWLSKPNVYEPSDSFPYSPQVEARSRLIAARLRRICHNGEPVPSSAFHDALMELMAACEAIIADVRHGPRILPLCELQKAFDNAVAYAIAGMRVSGAARLSVEGETK